MPNKKALSIIMALLPLTVLAPEPHDSCKMVKIVPERLPDLTIPRHSNLAVFCRNGELTIFGGHTTGFVLTPTAEYYSNGKWHQIPMTYNHDYGFCVRLSSGKMLLGGGATQNLGIGQSYETEVYDPETHAFDRYGCLDKKRFHSAGIELDSGRVVIAGNWYTKNGIEQYDTLNNTFTFVKDEVQPRSHPYIFRIAKDDAIIFSCVGERGDTIFSPIVDRLKGEPFSVPLFETWTPLYPHSDFFSDDSFIGDASRGEYAYLLPVINRDGQVAIAQVRDTVFSLLPTVCPIPMESPWSRIQWFGTILVDRQLQRGYLTGTDTDCRHYILAIDYTQEPVRLALNYTDPMPDAGSVLPVISPEGDLYIVGGINAKCNNFNPLSSVLRYRFGMNHGDRSLDSAWNHGPVLMILLAIAILVALILFAFFRLKHKAPESIAPDTDEALMQRIIDLMENKKLYLNSNLKMSDVAIELGIHQNQVSACINTNKGISFNQFVNSYRVEYAKQQLCKQSDIKMTQVALDSGFANEKSFFRSFKALTDMTPREWQSHQALSGID